MAHQPWMRSQKLHTLVSYEFFIETNTLTPNLVLINRDQSSAKYPQQQTSSLQFSYFIYSSISSHLIMAVFTFEDQTTSPVSPATLYKALVKDADNIVPKAVDSFKSVEIVEGNGSPGTIKKISFLEGTLFIHFLYILCTCINTVYSI